MRDYTGYWLECGNGNCGFPIRVPYSSSGKRKKRGRESGPDSLLFACPVCLHVKPYKINDLRKILFRSPDPYAAGKLVLYSTRIGCGHRRCPRQFTIFTVAAAKVSIAALLQSWKGWKANLRCDDHRFQMSNTNTWWIQEEKSLAGLGR